MTGPAGPSLLYPSFNVSEGPIMPTGQDLQGLAAQVAAGGGGATGATGPTGPAGPTGDTGATGATGGANILTTTLSLSSSQILNAATTAVEAIAAPGAGKLIQVFGSFIDYIYGTMTYAGGISGAGLFYGADTTTSIDGGAIAPVLGGAANTWAAPSGGVGPTLVSSVAFEDEPVNFAAAMAPTTGDGTAKVYITYQIVTL